MEKYAVVIREFVLTAITIQQFLTDIIFTNSQHRATGTSQDILVKPYSCEDCLDGIVERLANGLIDTALIVLVDVIAKSSAYKDKR